MGCIYFSWQECESREPYEGLITQYKFLGAAEAHRGYVQLYVRIREGFHAEVVRDENLARNPVVKARLRFETRVAHAQRHWKILAVNLPHGHENKSRRMILDNFVPTSDREDAVLLLGDFNAVDEEVRSFCVSKVLTAVTYSGPTWGAPRNKFHEGPVAFGGNTRGLRYDWMLYRGCLCA